MEKYLITFRSVTYAQKGERALWRAGIDCLLRRTPRMLTDKACGYCLQLRPQYLAEALEVLQERQVQFGKVYGLVDGAFEELTV